MRFFARALTLLLIAGRIGPATAGPVGPPDEPDRPTAEVVYRWDGSAWVPDSRTVFSYERDEGESTRGIHQVWEGEAWADVSKEVWTLDAEGRQTTGRMYERTDGAWAEQMDLAFFYDADGHKTAARRRSLGDDGLANADSLASTFENGLETERRFFRWQDGAWAEGLRQASAYDADGQETERVHLAPADGTWEERRRWRFTYHDGTVTSSVVEEKTDGTWTPWLNQTYAYDAEGRLVEVVHEEWNGEAWANLMKNETRYGPVGVVGQGDVKP